MFLGFYSFKQFHKIIFRYCDTGGNFLLFFSQRLTVFCCNVVDWQDLDFSCIDSTVPCFTKDMQALPMATIWSAAEGFPVLAYLIGTALRVLLILGLLL